ncbi:hypothetical protein PC129_g20841 [Phytophthora cactorum]|uniref:Uncharacterized protein n=1 Tax=Phytophthora cactorum TaxID=29920 RepID=A0A329S8B6_9STRA|nr:hypothetical protein Pcac1_g5061 [Phytophthora cactorum]KAG2798378.1 hypothetical protein PC111_g20880 [Phytophthora cactorum]KAG2804407.1 hypothetical protein PC112_g18734 [Phytophthora cactorum]KAG2844405.1 hypothetical protein PC113_g18406 [Phytophthora cactorum]KAG2876948.1 hypothetical protein PC114_g23912 [Phytophthora cactorum]
MCCTALGLSVFSGGLADDDEWDANVDEIMANFTNEDIVGQMTQIASYGLLNSRTKMFCAVLPSTVLARTWVLPCRILERSGLDHG